jgi:6-phospho-beta-glucosidase
MRLMIAGGGGFRVPLVYRALCSARFEGLVQDVVLYDVDPVRLDAITAVLDAMPVSGQATRPGVTATTSLTEALAGTDAVFAAVRPGGTAGRVADEKVALDLGLLGQETTGAGGISYALRSIPPMLELAAAMREHCPEAWLINFTNPAGIITEAVEPLLGPRVIGICDSAGALVKHAAKAARVSLPEGRLDGVGYYGLNHLGWLYKLVVDGRDRLPGLLADGDALAGFEEGRLFGQTLLERLGCLPNEYLFYYYETSRATHAILRMRESRGESIHRQQADLYPRLARMGTPADSSRDGLDAYRLWDLARRSREEGYLAEARAEDEQRDDEDLAGGGYESVALSVLHALSGGGSVDLILNRPNALVTPAGGDRAEGVAIPGLPADAVVEVPCRVTSDGAAPLPQERPQGAQLTLMTHVKEVERLTIRAATQGDRDAAVQAFAEHPLVGSEALGLSLLAGYEEAFPALRELWRKA